MQRKFQHFRNLESAEMNLATLAPTELQYEVFSQHYVANGYNALKAAVAAGWENPSPMLAANIRSRGYVKRRVAEIVGDQLESLQVDAERVKEEIVKIAFQDPRGMFTQDGRLRNVHDLDDGTAASISGIDVEIKVQKGGSAAGDDEAEQTLETRIVKIKRYDKMAALTLLAKHFKIVGDESDGVNALAGALADRLDAAKRRAFDPTSPDIEDATPARPQAPPATLDTVLGDPLDLAPPAEPMRAVALAPARQTLSMAPPAPVHFEPIPTFLQGASDEDLF